MIKFCLAVVASFLLYSASADKAVSGGIEQVKAFVQKIDPSQKQQLLTILNSDSMTRAEIEQKIEEWAKDHGDETLSAYNSAKQYVVALAEEIIQKMQASSLPDKIKNVAQQLYGIYSNNSLTLKDTIDQGRNILDSLTADERQQMFQVLMNHTLSEFRHLSDNLSNEAKTELQTILNNVSLTQVEIEANLERWAHQQGEYIVKAYNEIKNRIPVTINSVVEKIQASKLSEDAKTIAKQVYDEYNNKTLTIKEAAERAESLLSKVSDSVKQEIDKLLWLHNRKKRGNIEEIDHLLRAKLLEIPSYKRVALENILTNEILTKQEKINLLFDWATQQDAEIKEILEKIYSRHQSRVDNYRQLISGDTTLSEEARAALFEALAVAENLELTLKEDEQQQKAILDKQSRNVRKEITEYCTKIGHL
uniref:DUF148 domain-containing protein n=1 Tax=Syphacia muris TaxID=451379 RepID=A0A0N5ASB7_9BILA